MLYYEFKLKIYIYKCTVNNYEMFLGALDNVDHKYELYKKLGENHTRKMNEPNISVVHKCHTTKSTMHPICKGGQPKCTCISNINKISCKLST